MGEQQVMEIIRQAQRELACGVCGRKFELGEIKLRGIMDAHYLVQTACHRGHSPSIMLYVLGSQPKPVAAMSTDDVLDLHQALKSFNGDFRSIFNRIDAKK